jgi:aminopeptidase YwaD
MRDGIQHLCSLILLIIILLCPSYADDNVPSITEEEIIGHIKYLASDRLEGRSPGSPGGEEAARYIAAEFEKAGLEPPGDSGSYYQKFTFPGEVVLGRSGSLNLILNGESTDLELGKDYYPLGFSQNGYASGDIVFAGYGITAPEAGYDDYSGLDVKGKIVLVLRYSPDGLRYDSPFFNYSTLRYKAVNAREHGAAAALFTTSFSGDGEEAIKHPSLDYSTSDSGIQAAVITKDKAREILSLSGRNPDEVAQNLSGRKPDSFPIPGARASIRTDIVQKNIETANVLGLVEGSDPVLGKEVVIVGAHYDHIGRGGGNSMAGPSGRGQVHNGADDNASGVAALIELAEYFSHKRKELDRSLLFIAFSGEEIGLLGSTYYIEHPAIPLDRTVAMINMDMIGRLRDNNLIVFGLGSSRGWKRLILAANEGPDLNLSFQDSAFGPSDQSVFYTYEIPAVQFFTGLHEDYHTPTDDWEMINSSGEKRLLRLVSGLIEELSSGSSNLVFNKGSGQASNVAGLKIYLGTVPDYSSQAPGVRLAGVRAGSPASAAGLRAGDTIIELNGKEIKNIYDYSYTLNTLEAGDSTELKIMRGGEKITLQIIPENR